jgi:hypothetical protein
LGGEGILLFRLAGAHWLVTFRDSLTGVSHTDTVVRAILTGGSHNCSAPVWIITGFCDWGSSEVPIAIICLG